MQAGGLGDLLGLGGRCGKRITFVTWPQICPKNGGIPPFRRLRFRHYL